MWIRPAFVLVQELLFQPTDPLLDLAYVHLFRPDLPAVAAQNIEPSCTRTELTRRACISLGYRPSFTCGIFRAFPEADVARGGEGGPVCGVWLALNLRRHLARHRRQRRRWSARRIRLVDHQPTSVSATARSAAKRGASSALFIF
jgi:hypothetical protein